MIIKAHRFHGHASLRYVYRHGVTVRGAWFSVRYAENTKRSNYRAAVVVSKKVSKSAVVRNRIRRRVYEALRGFEDDIVRPYDIVLTIFSETVKDTKFEDLQKQLKRQLKEAGLLAKRLRPQPPSQKS